MGRDPRAHSRDGGGWRGTPEPVADTGWAEGEGEGSQSPQQRGMKRVCRPHSRGGWRGTPESIAETEGTEGEGDGPQKGVQRDPRAHSQMGTEGGREGPQTPQQIQRGGTGGYRGTPETPQQIQRGGMGDPTADTERGYGGTPETPQQIQRGAEGCREGPQSPQQSQTGGGGRPQTPTPRAELGYSRSATTLLRKDWMYMGMMQKRSPTTGSQGSPRGGGRLGRGGSPLCPPLLPHIDTEGGVHALLARPQRGLKVMMM